ncbi:MAG: 50S ribosomal protein L25 [Myxococcales bacterium]|nr:50S ribosomal protein L25 [Myxococcales bacterium]|tara:strand:- start:7066 stop:7677 length:612 start_codon:yes stop_codon:yes gene_type:complete
MSENKLDAVVRTLTGKGAARKSRKAGRLPAVVYSKGQETLGVEVSPRELTHILRRPLRRNVLIELAVEGDSTRHVMVRDIQKHPVRRDLVHVDFVQVDPSQEVIVEVPVALQGRAKSVVAGGKLEQVRRFVTVSCLPTVIPAQIDVDITDLPFGSTRTANIALPNGLTLQDDPALSVITIKAPRGKQAAEEEEGEAAAAPAQG